MFIFLMICSSDGTSLLYCNCRRQLNRLAGFLYCAWQYHNNNFFTILDSERDVLDCRANDQNYYITDLLTPKFLKFCLFYPETKMVASFEKILRFSVFLTIISSALFSLLLSFCVFCYCCCCIVFKVHIKLLAWNVCTKPILILCMWMAGSDRYFF